MKKLLTLLVCIVLYSTKLYSQSPDAFKYQAVLKDNEGKPLVNQTINMGVSVIKGSPTEPGLYTETHIVQTDQQGGVTIEIGKGNTSDNFSVIDWTAGIYFIKINVNGSDLGTFQLLSVPYAKFADKAGNVFSGNYSDLTGAPDFTDWDKNANDDFSGKYSDLTEKPNLSDTSKYIKSIDPQLGDLLFYNGTDWQSLSLGDNTQVLRIENNQPVWRYTNPVVTDNYIGKLVEDGIVFYVSPDGQHGLIAAFYDLDDGYGVYWSDISSEEAMAQSWYNGYSNTDSIIQQGAANSAAQLCKTLGGDWYLPSSWEFHLLFDKIYEINKILDNDGNPETKRLEISSSSPEGRYWTSTENGLNRAWSFQINLGINANSNKLTKCRVRAIRSF